MLRKSRTRRTLAAGVALVLCLLLVPVVWAAITVDGVCTDGDWSGKLDVTDPQDVFPQSDEYDIGDLYTLEESDGDFFLRFDTLANIVVTGDAFINIWFDTDSDPITGWSAYGAGWDYRLRWNMPTGDDSCEVAYWDGDFDQLACSGDLCCDGDWGSSSTCTEIFVSGEDIQLGGNPMPILLYFDNGTLPSDDIVLWDHELTTAVELSSFTACSERGRPSEPWFTWLWPVGLVSGVVAVSAGGIVLWRRKGLAR